MLAETQLKQLQCQVDKKAIQGMMVPLQKVLRHSFEGIWVSEPSVQKVKALIKQGDHVILMPTYKSFAD